MTSFEFFKLMHDLKPSTTLDQFIVRGKKQAVSSAVPAIHSLSSSRKRQFFNEKIDPPKDDSALFEDPLLSRNSRYRDNSWRIWWIKCVETSTWRHSNDFWLGVNTITNALTSMSLHIVNAFGQHLFACCLKLTRLEHHHNHSIC